MCVTNNIGKEFLKILCKNFLPTSSLYKIFKKSNVRLSYSCMLNVFNLINKSNIKKLMNKQSKEPPKSKCIGKTNCPLRGKCPYKSRVYKVEVYCNHNAMKNNNKKVYIESTQDAFKKGFYNHKCNFTREMYKNRTSLSKYI